VVPRRVLAAAATWEESAQLAAVEAACGAQLLEEEGAEAYHFLHDVTREVIEAELGAARRLVLHRRIAEALEAQPGEPPVELLAYHYERSGVHEQAGDHAAAQHAHAGAEGYYRELVERLHGLGSSGPGP
jgi:predicted ATPase